MKKPLPQITFDFAAGEEASDVLSMAEEPVAAIDNTKAEPKLSAKKIKQQPEQLIPAVAPGKRGRKSLKDTAISTAVIDIPADEELFKKQYYSIGDVAAMFREKQSLIRYWEIEFDILQPKKNKKGDRFFRPIDVKNLEMIYDLLRRRKFTIEGAKDYLKKNKRAEEKYALIQSLEKVKGFLMELKASL